MALRSFAVVPLLFDSLQACWQAREGVSFLGCTNSLCDGFALRMDAHYCPMLLFYQVGFPFLFDFSGVASMKYDDVIHDKLFLAI